MPPTPPPPARCRRHERELAATQLQKLSLAAELAGTCSAPPAGELEAAAGEAGSPTVSSPQKFEPQRRRLAALLAGGARKLEGGLDALARKAREARQ